MALILTEYLLVDTFTVDSGLLMKYHQNHLTNLLFLSGAFSVPDDPHRRDPDGTLRPHVCHHPPGPAGGGAGHIPPGAAEEHIRGLHHQRGRLPSLHLLHREGSSRGRREAEGVTSPAIAGEGRKRRRSEAGAGREHSHLHQGHRLTLHRLRGAR